MGANYVASQHKGSVYRHYWRAMASVVAALLFVASAIEIYYTYQNGVQAQRQLQLSYARDGATALASYFGNLETELLQLANLPLSDVGLSKDAVRDAANLVLSRHTELMEISVLDKNDRPVAFASRIKISAPEFIDASMLLSIKQLNPNVARKYTPAFLANGYQPYTNVILRKLNGSKNTVFAQINLQFLTQVIQRLSRQDGILAYVLDESGRLVAHQEFHRVLSTVSNLSQAERTLKTVPIAIEKTHSNEVSTFRAGDAWAIGVDDGQRVLRSVVALENQGWRVAVEQLETEVLHPVYAALVRSIALLAIALVIATLAARKLASQLTRPILELGRGALAFGAGNLDTRVVVTTDNELASVAGTFNSMAAQLQDYTQTLEQKVAEKTRQLEAANQHKSEFLANMSHELRTPLNAVIGFSDALKEEYFGPLNDKQKEYVHDISGSGQHLLSLINDILDLSKIEAGKMELELSRFNLTAAIDTAMVLVRERALRYGITLKAEIAPDLGDITADERKVKQVLINLLTNAVKFSHPLGWVVVTAQRDINATVNSVTISVADTGVGIAEDDQGEIFAEFYQVKQGGTAKQEGTGLGLALTQRFIALHGGKIWVESAVGKGAKFTFILPDAGVEK